MCLDLTLLHSLSLVVRCEVERGRMSDLEEHMIDLTIEALTGTVYDLCVSPFETILGIKMKIQRLEGREAVPVPVYYSEQQLVPMCIHANTCTCCVPSLRFYIVVVQAQAYISTAGSIACLCVR